MTLAEISARTGPRTGAFSLDSGIINHVYTLAAKYYEEFKKNPKFKQQTEIVVMKNPINGKPTRIPFVYVYMPKETATGWFKPNKNSTSGRVYLNVANYSTDPWFKTVINHELTHLFDKAVTGSAAWDAAAEDYFASPREKFAFLHQFIAGIQEYSMEVKKDIEAGKPSSILLAQTLTKKPQYLLRNLVNRDTQLRNILGWYIDDVEFMKKLMTACFYAIQNNIIPAVQAHNQKLPAK